MKKINLFYLLFALSSSHSLSAANSDITEYLQLGFWESFILKYNGFINEDEFSCIKTKDSKDKIEPFIIQKITYKIAQRKKINFLNNKLKVDSKSDVKSISKALKSSSEKKWIEEVLSSQKFTKIQKLCSKWDMIQLKDLDGNVGNVETYQTIKSIKEALGKGRGYVFFKDKSNTFKVEPFNFWDWNVKGIAAIVVATLCTLGVVLSSITYSLGFFSSSETDKKYETNYIV